MEIKILGRSKIQKDGRLTIPKKVREVLGIDIGDRVVLEFENKQLTLTKA